MKQQTSRPGDGIEKAVRLLVADDVLGLFSIEALYEIAQAVHRRAHSMDGWGPGQMFVDDYTAKDGSVVRFVYPYGDAVKVALKDSLQFSRLTVQDGNHRCSDSGSLADPSVLAEAVHLPGEFVRFDAQPRECTGQSETWR